MNKAELKVHWDGVIGGLRFKRKCFDVLKGHKVPNDFCKTRHPFTDEYHAYYLYLKGLIAEIEDGK